jgi:hypothetical protein
MSAWNWLGLSDRRRRHLWSDGGHFISIEMSGINGLPIEVNRRPSQLRIDWLTFCVKGTPSCFVEIHLDGMNPIYLFLSSIELSEAFLELISKPQSITFSSQVCTNVVPEAILLFLAQPLANATWLRDEGFWPFLAKVSLYNYICRPTCQWINALNRISLDLNIQDKL